jgi:hypothetical protein
VCEFTGVGGAIMAAKTVDWNGDLASSPVFDQKLTGTTPPCPPVVIPVGLSWFSPC